MRPIVDIYSTFLQRSFDQIFQEVALQNLPVVFTLDRAGLTGPDGPTHHGVFDIAYMRLFPNLVVMAPGDELDVAPMLRFALAHNGPASLRYPKASLEKVERAVAPIELGQAEVYEWGEDGVLVAYGTLFPTCVKAAEELRAGRAGRRRHQRPLRQAARPRHAAARHRGDAAGRHGRGRHAGRRLRQRRAGSGQRRRPGYAATSCVWACPTASSSTPSAANCWRISVWMSAASVRHGSASAWRRKVEKDCAV